MYVCTSLRYVIEIFPSCSLLSCDSKVRQEGLFDVLESLLKICR